MKKTNLLFWIFTGIFGAFMAFSGFMNTFMITESEPVYIGLGYPTYLIPFMGIAKLLGVFAIVMPGFQRLKEWAYAGLFFDLLGAAYSTICVSGFQPPILFMFVFFLFGGLSYFYHHKRLKESVA